jgi:hypothetical protein
MAMLGRKPTRVGLYSNVQKTHKSWVGVHACRRDAINAHATAQLHNKHAYAQMCNRPCEGCAAALLGSVRGVLRNNLYSTAGSSLLLHAPLLSQRTRQLQL